jgi:glycosyltransferase involved in cell wall biosynthesis
VIRVLHLLTTLDLGGAEAQTLSLVRRFPADRYRFSAAWLKGRGEMAPAYRRAGCELTDLRLRGAADPTVLGRAVELVRRTRPHVVHTHMMKADLVGGLAARLGGAPVLVSTKHNEDDYLRWPPLALAARAVAELADRLIVISDAVGRFFRRRLLLRESRMTRIFHGLPVNGRGPADPAERDAFRRELGLGRDTRLVVTVARLTRQKGIDDLLHAASAARDALPDAVFLIVGRGELRDALRETARRLDLGDRARFLGLRHDVERILSCADLLVLPSLWEGFGLVLLQAMDAGLPIVATRAGAIPEVVVDGETGLLAPPRDPDSLATAILRVLRNPDRAAAMGRAGRERLGRSFSIEEEVRAHAALYEELLLRRAERRCASSS